MSREGCARAVERMAAAGVDQRAITVFEHYWEQLAAGEQGMVREDTLEPLVDVPELAALEVDDEARREALARVAVVKLNPP